MILIVEDDAHKSSQISDICAALAYDIDGRTIVDNVKDVVRYLVHNTPLKIVLDMSLPSHKALPGQGTPVPMPTGGIEVLFELKMKKIMHIPILILTQYPEIEIEGEPYPIDESAETLKDMYGFKNIQACYYESKKNAKWINVTTEFLRN
ncbi:TPA: response regulator transcription factor [Klebsiella aerogenes]|nr:response regulator transcription factor [Klebsiella aerogenes]